MSEANPSGDCGVRTFRDALLRAEARTAEMLDTSFTEHAAMSDEASAVGVEPTTPEDAIEQLSEDRANQVAWEAFHRQKRRRLRLSFVLFLLTFVSTTLVGANYWPLEIFPGFFSERHAERVLATMNEYWPPPSGVTYTVTERFWQTVRTGCSYSIPLMAILLCHEMGHFLQAVRYRVPASFPFFIPLPLPPLGTMGAVILQGRGKADRKMMFDIAVSGPLAGLVITIPVLYYGIVTSDYVPVDPNDWGFQFGQSIMVRWMIESVHGVAPPGMAFDWNGIATAGWVGVLITAMNLLPIGQLDGGHILYTLIGRAAHWVAWGLIIAAVAGMVATGLYSYVLLLILLMITGPRHPPTANDNMPLGKDRIILGWLTLSFLIVGFTFQPLVVSQPDYVDPGATLEPINIDELDDFEQWL